MGPRRIKSASLGTTAHMGLLEVCNKYRDLRKRACAFHFSRVWFVLCGENGQKCENLGVRVYMSIFDFMHGFSPNFLLHLKRARLQIRLINMLLVFDTTPE